MNKYYCNRELSWLKFNERVLEEARDTSVPLCERLLFASIFQSNLDEFFMVRVGSLYDQTIVGGDEKENKTGMTCGEQLIEIFKQVQLLCPVRDKTYFNIMTELEKHYNIKQVDFRALSAEEESYLQVFFRTEILPLISPQVIDKRNPFPFLKNKEIYACARLDSKSVSTVKIGLVPASGAFQRVIFLPGNENEQMRFMLVEELILHYIPIIFENYKIIEKSLVRITRNADINMEEALYDHDVDFREVMTELLKKRKKLSPVRMELSRKLGAEVVNYLCIHLDISEEQIFKLKSPLDLSFNSVLRSRLEPHYPMLCFPKSEPQQSLEIVKSEPVIQQVLRKDILLSYPYESIKPFLSLLSEAAADPSVVSIKITLYRLASNSKVVEALIAAAENGKDVFVLVELRARFDEENNINWSERLEQAGCTVIYGPENIKVHSKLLLITRKSNGKVQYITQIGTGNYNEKTSRLYTDFSLLTADTNLGVEAGTVFNALAMGTLVENTEHLLVSPLCLQNKILSMMDYEIAMAESGENAYIGLKLNSLTDKVLIDKLAEASQKGVKIQMIIRGICCLAAGIKGYTENIEVYSIVGRMLEHSRIYIFGTSERAKVYISSADFMTRNTIRRVEVAAPVYNKNVRERILSIFNIMLSDNVKARKMQPDGTYIIKEPLGEKLNSQEYFIHEAYESAKKILTTAETKHNIRKNILRWFKKLLSVKKK